MATIALPQRQTEAYKALSTGSACCENTTSAGMLTGKGSEQTMDKKD
jgi:hypothetical protein